MDERLKADIVVVDGQTIHVLSKGRAKITETDISDYVKSLSTQVKLIPDNLHNIFLQDLNNGVQFCVTKYGLKPHEVTQEARRIAPQKMFKET